MTNRKIADIVEDKKVLVLPEHQTARSLSVHVGVAHRRGAGTQ